MNEDALNMEIRKFLKKVGVTSQREIEQGVRQALDSGKAVEGTQIKLSVLLEVPDLDIRHRIDGTLDIS